MEDVFRQFGAPEILQTDNGLEFTGGSVSDLLEKWDVKHVCGQPKKPRVQGAVERLNHTLKSRIERMVAEGTELGESEFQRILGVVAHHYNWDRTRTTGFPPAELYFGRSLHPTPRDQDIEDGDETDIEALNALEEERADRRTEALATSREYYSKETKRYLKRPKLPVVIRVGDKVLLPFELTLRPGVKFKKGDNIVGKVTEKVGERIKVDWENEEGDNTLYCYTWEVDLSVR